MTGREKVNEYIFGFILPTPEYFFLCLRRIKAAKIIYVSIDDAFSFTKYFFLSVFGTIFTHEIFIVKVLLT